MFPEENRTEGPEACDCTLSQKKQCQFKNYIGVSQIKKKKLHSSTEEERMAFYQDPVYQIGKKKKEKEIISNQRCCLVWQNTLTHQANSHKQSKNKGSSRHTFGVLISTLPSLTSGLCPGMT